MWKPRIFVAEVIVHEQVNSPAIEPEFLISAPEVVEPFVSAGQGGWLSIDPIKPPSDQVNWKAFVEVTVTLIATAVPASNVCEQLTVKLVHVFATLPPAVKVIVPIAVCE